MSNQSVRAAAIAKQLAQDRLDAIKQTEGRSWNIIPSQLFITIWPFRFMIHKAFTVVGVHPTIIISIWTYLILSWLNIYFSLPPLLHHYLSFPFFLNCIVQPSNLCLFIFLLSSHPVTFYHLTRWFSLSVNLCIHVESCQNARNGRCQVKGDIPTSWKKGKHEWVD